MSQGISSILPVSLLPVTAWGKFFPFAAFLSEGNSHLIGTLVKTYFMGNNNGAKLFFDEKEPHSPGETKTKISHWIKCWTVLLSYTWFWWFFFFPQMKWSGYHLPVKTCLPIAGMLSISSGCTELQRSLCCRWQELGNFQPPRPARMFKVFPSAHLRAPSLDLRHWSPQGATCCLAAGGLPAALTPCWDHCVTSSLAASWPAAKQKSDRS